MKNHKATVYDCLRSETPEGQIERIVVKDGYIEYRIWKPYCEFYNGKPVSFGRTCTMKYLATPDDMHLVFDDRYFIKDKRAESYTEDPEFYQKYALIGPMPKPIKGTWEDEMMDKMEKMKKRKK